jgi:NAD(P)-dependent dehydrogenase (short-subunit alcohol dehydrogenase family)
MSSKLARRVVLITGAAKGIGLATAAEFAKAGATLVITDRDPTALALAEPKLRAHAVEVKSYVVDVTDRAAVEAMAKDVLARLGALDVLINNAGIGYSGELAETTLETWHRLFAVNFWGPLHHVYAFLPSMKQRRSGHIVNVSSGQAFFRLPTWGAYATAKLALGGFSELLHYELARDGIHVTTVYPYMVNTGFYDEVTTATLAARLSMRLLPYYSDTPEKVGRLIFQAVLKKKKVEMVSLLNDFGFYSRLIPPVSDAVSYVSNWLLAKSASGGSQ